jgi:catechol 2,3-dioxygenase-like lactoylglutathione lyase family enzyme
MFGDNKAFSSFSVDDLDKAEQFYADVLGVGVEKNDIGLTLKFAGGNKIFIYPKPDHRPATYTALYFPVEDIDAAADKLVAAGIVLEQYDMDELKQDERGVFHSQDVSQGPSIAWFKDPAGNILSIIEEKSEI